MIKENEDLEVRRCLSASYYMISSIFQHGVKESHLPILSKMESFAAHFSGDETVLLRELAITHQNLFGRQVYPFAGMFLEHSMLAGRQVNFRSYCQGTVDFSWQSHGGFCDDISVLLAFLGYLVGSRRDAIDVQHESCFIHNEILSWFFPFKRAVERQGNSFYSKLMVFCSKLFERHLSYLALLSCPVHRGFTEKNPEKPRDEELDRDAYENFLLTPSLSGLYLSSDDIRAMASALQAPVGCGNRKVMLKNLCEFVQKHQIERELFDLIFRFYGDWREASRGDVWEVRVLQGKEVLERWRQCAVAIA